jgi:monoterpene epsilon-lactone hydrolase
VLRTLFIALRALLAATLHRIVNGPSLPGWTWKLEWLVAAYRAALCDSMRRSPAEMRALAAPPPSRSARRLSIERVDLGGVPARCAQPPGSAPERFLLYIHGGGFVVGGSHTHLDLTASLTSASDARSWSIDYRLAPEHPFPAAGDDVLAAYRALLERGVDPARLVVAGDSAGATLALGLLIRLRDGGLPLPAAGVLIAPAADLRLPGQSWETRRRTDWITKELCQYWIAHYLQDRDARDPAASPIHADLRGLPPLLVQVGTAECLHDDVLELVDRLKSASVDVTLAEYAAMPHVWHLFRIFVPEAERAIAEIAAFVCARTQGAVSRPSARS